MVQRISSRVPVPVKSFALVEDVSSSFNRIVGTWTRKIHIRKESQPILANRSMVCNGSNCAGAQRIGVPEGLKPRTAFLVMRLDRVEIVI